MPRCGYDPELASISHLNEKSKKWGGHPRCPPHSNRAEARTPTPYARFFLRIIGINPKRPVPSNAIDDGSGVV